MKAPPLRAMLAFTVLASATMASRPVHAQEGGDRRAYNLLRDDENWAWLRQRHAVDDFWDPVKYLRIGGRDDVYLTLGGETREWVEGYQNELWGQTGVATNIDWLQRYMVHAGPVPAGRN